MVVSILPEGFLIFFCTSWSLPSLPQIEGHHVVDVALLDHVDRGGGTQFHCGRPRHADSDLLPLQQAHQVESLLVKTGLTLQHLTAN